MTVSVLTAEAIGIDVHGGHPRRLGAFHDAVHGVADMVGIRSRLATAPPLHARAVNQYRL